MTSLKADECSWEFWSFMGDEVETMLSNVAVISLATADNQDWCLNFVEQEGDERLVQEDTGCDFGGVGLDEIPESLCGALAMSGNGNPLGVNLECCVLPVLGKLDGVALESWAGVSCSSVQWAWYDDEVSVRCELGQETLVLASISVGTTVLPSNDWNWCVCWDVLWDVDSSAREGFVVLDQGDGVKTGW